MIVLVVNRRASGLDIIAPEGGYKTAHAALADGTKLFPKKRRINWWVQATSTLEEVTWLHPDAAKPTSS